MNREVTRCKWEQLYHLAKELSHITYSTQNEQNEAQEIRNASERILKSFNTNYKQRY